MILEGGNDNSGANRFSKAVKKTRHALDDLSSAEVVEEKINVGSMLSKFQTHSNQTESEQLLACTIASLLDTDDSSSLLKSALVLHSRLLQHIPISQRRLSAVVFDEKMEFKIKTFLDGYAKTAAAILHSREWVETMRDHNITSDLVDCIDGRLFRATIQAILSGNVQDVIPQAIKADWEKATATIGLLSDQVLSLTPTKIETVDSSTKSVTESSEGIAVMPFSNPIFDKHLECIHVTTEAALPSRTAAMKIYRETTHWHNHRKPLNPKQQPEVKVSKWHVCIT